MKKKYNKSKSRRLDREDTFANIETGVWLWNASRVLRDSNLKEFWSKWREFSVLTPMEEKQKLLISMTVQVYKVHNLGKLHNARTRNRFHLFKDSIPIDKPCGCCEAPAQIRHHIVPIQNGGHNAPLNLIQLCKECHSAIHPWMRKEDSNATTALVAAGSLDRIPGCKKEQKDGNDAAR